MSDELGANEGPGDRAQPDQAVDPVLEPVLRAAGERLRAESRPVEPAAVENAVLSRRSRRRGMGLVAAGAAVVMLGASLAVAVRDDAGGGGSGPLADGLTGAERAEVDEIVASLDPSPIDPTTVQLVSSVSTFSDCDALVDDLRRVGAQHVGSRGFGGSAAALQRTGYAIDGAARDAVNFGPDGEAPATVPATGGDEAGATLGTNVQVVGVDELDFVKAVEDRIYDLDGKGNLRITDAATLEVLAAVDVTPETAGDGGADVPGGMPYPGSGVSRILVHEGRAAVFGTEVEVSDPIEGDPSATRSSTSYLTVTFVDVSDPASASVTDRVRLEGSLVSARLVEGEVRMVTGAHMADLGFLMPTTPTSVPKALEANRRSVAASTAPDWIPDWQRDGEDPQPLVPCERVHVPDTFAGVAMTSMVTFPMEPGSFDPLATSILAPSTTLYAGLEKVAISSEVWVDPADRERLEFDHWQTAVHEFGFAAGEAPGYEGSGIVDGSTIGQFAFGEIGDSLAVVTTEGTPWRQGSEVEVDLTVLTPDGEGGLVRTSQVEDLADGDGSVTAVRFVEARVLVSTGVFGRVVQVIDVADPAAPRRAGSTTLPGDVGYFHPLPQNRALLVGSRTDWVGDAPNALTRSWVQAHLLDVSDPDSPRVVDTWERPWSQDSVSGDHHAFTYWPDRGLAMWGVRSTRYEGPASPPPPNHAVVLRADPALGEVAVPEASKPVEVPAPCAVVEVTDPEARSMIGSDTVVLRCDDQAVTELEWPRYHCSRVDEGTVARFAPGQQGAFFTCYPAGPPAVSRVLVVRGTPILLTDQTLERLDPETFGSTAIAYHPTGRGIGW